MLQLSKLDVPFDRGDLSTTSGVQAGSASGIGFCFVVAGGVIRWQWYQHAHRPLLSTRCAKPTEFTWLSGKIDGHSGSIETRDPAQVLSHWRFSSVAYIDASVGCDAYHITIAPAVSAGWCLHTKGHYLQRTLII